MEEDVIEAEIDEAEAEIDEDKHQDIENAEQDHSNRIKLGRKGVLSLRYQMIAEYASRGYPPGIIARDLRINVKRVYHILRTNKLVHEEIRRIISERFSESEKMLGYLFIKALSKIDFDMESANIEQRDKAIDRVIKMYGNMKAGGLQPTNINQFFNMGGGDVVQDIDALILQKRRDRGLEPPLIEKKDDSE
ncbi:hypothetical protein A2Z67_05090 [Candidatus Woesebacteria bacterium RBG_13_36_22]|uniref:Uncharacterized protein n=1 Tax=Candidatus Woesebacteria bacterium RBG_13_36_22 TaxID=1802478 RepID=A0A1F7X2S4_9BACT|nr:MAG: hypothetical protein A2Z67_05090 [Candidatus Woesebacteria bacterium RBG_13_36_22]